MTLSDILAVKGRRVFTIAAHATLADVVDQLVAHNVGSLVVCDGGGFMVGIITERDILRACALQLGPLETLPIARFMTQQVITAAPHDDVENIMGLMTEHRIRHLPVLEHDRLIGIISIGDIVKAQYENLCRENHYLMAYIQS
jgi:CBS domain-containing protein